MAPRTGYGQVALQCRWFKPLKKAFTASTTPLRTPLPVQDERSISTSIRTWTVGLAPPGSGSVQRVLHGTQSRKWVSEEQKYQGKGWSRG